MTTTTKHAPGTFCWPELATTDQDAAKKFYTSLFGWTYRDVPMGPDAGVYTIFQSKGQDAAALFTQMPEMMQQGIPPHWGSYVSVADVDDVARRAKSLGGTVMMEPFDVMGTMGRMAVLRDPTGAVLSAWQAKDHPGVGILDENGALCWTELMTGDPARAATFYKSLIGWSSEEMQVDGRSYTLFKRSDGANAAGMMKMPDDMKGVPPHWLIYFQVGDIQGTVDKAAKSSAKVLVPPTPIPGIGRFAVVADGQGAAFGLLQP